jgi:hypothetical protein
MDNFKEIKRLGFLLNSFRVPLKWTRLWPITKIIRLFLIQKEVKPHQEIPVLRIEDQTNSKFKIKVIYYSTIQGRGITPNNEY